LTQSLKIDPQTTTNEVDLLFKTNTSSVGTTTASIIANGGTTLNTGTLSLYAGAIRLGNVDLLSAIAIYGSVAFQSGPSGFAFTNSALLSTLTIDPYTSGTVNLKFKTNTADNSITTAVIYATGGSGTGTGNIINRCGSSFFFNNAENQSLRINPTSTAGAVDVIWRCNTSTPSQASVTMRGDNGTGVNDGTLTTYCGKTAVRASTGNFCAIEQSVASDTATINFKSSTANDVISSSITATGGSSSANSGTLEVEGNILNLNTTTTSINNFTTNINSTTTNIGSFTTNISSFTTNITSPTTSITGDLYLTNSSGSFKMWDNVSTGSFQYLTANVNLSTNAIAWNTMFCTKYAFGTAITVTLSQANNFENTNFTIYNGGSANITLTAGSGFRLFGPSLTRGGVLSLTIGSNSARRIRGSVFGATNFLNNVNDNGWFIENIG
jgi:hypothetical protein